MAGRVSARDALALASLVALTPALHALYPETPWVSKDTIAYLAMARELFADLRLYLPAWIHVDQGMILPPVFPFLVGLVSAPLSPDAVQAISVARWVGIGSLALASVPLYFLLRPYTDRGVAWLSIAALQLSLEYMRIGASALTEGTFILMVALTLLALRRYSKEFPTRLGVVAGVLCALCFLTRQIGLVVFPIGCAWVVLEVFASGGAVRRAGTALAPLAAGFLAVFSLYAVLLYAQTGQHPLQQQFRWDEYAVATTDPAVLADIDRIEARPADDYDQLYANRRLMFGLTPDGAEMYRFLQPDDSATAADASPAQATLAAVARAGRDVLPNLKGNLEHVAGAAGPFFFWAFLIASLSAFVVPERGWPEWRRRLPAVFVWGYVLAVSLLGDLVARYVVVLLPLVLLAVAQESYRLVRKFAHDRRIVTGAVVSVMLAGAFFMPRIDPLGPKAEEETRALPHLAFRDFLDTGSRVLSLHPLDAHLIGGSWMVLPNDSLGRVVEYGRRTGTEWIFVASYSLRRTEEKLYTRAAWHRSPLLEENYGELVKRCQRAESPWYRFDLYRILPAPGQVDDTSDVCERRPRT